MLAAALGAAGADEVRRWTDADGSVHVTITGRGGETRSPADARDTPASSRQRFSVEASLQRRSIERGLRRANARLADVGAAIEETERKELVVYSPPASDDAAGNQIALDAQRNAFLAARAFEREKADRLRELRREHRDLLHEIRGLWKEFAKLRASVEREYGSLPPWWRDRLDCPKCLDERAVLAELQRRKEGRARSRPEPTPAPQAGDDR